MEEGTTCGGGDDERVKGRQRQARMKVGRGCRTSARRRARYRAGRSDG
jgi:hypothetical protein